MVSQTMHMPEGFTLDSIIYLRTDSRFTDQDRLELGLQAWSMHKRNKRTERVRGGQYEGIMRSTGNYGLLGTFGGYEFRAELDAYFGKTIVSFLVTTPIDHSLN